MTTTHEHREYQGRLARGGVIPPRPALERRVQCQCGRQVIGGRDGVTRRAFGPVILWQARCACGSDLTTHLTQYIPEGE